VRRTPGDTNPRWLCLLVTAAPVVAGLALAWGRPGAVKPPAGDRAPTTATAETRSSTRR
jgi:hypothetical protein